MLLGNPFSKVDDWLDWDVELLQFSSFMLAAIVKLEGVRVGKRFGACGADVLAIFLDMFNVFLRFR